MAARERGERVFDSYRLVLYVLAGWRNHRSPTSSLPCCSRALEYSVYSVWSSLGYAEAGCGAFSQLARQANPPNPRTFPFILLGNKIDVDGGNSRVVSEKKAKEWCASKGNIPYFETSAKEDYNVDAAFFCIAKTALANEREQDM
uniref:Ras-related protein Rab7 n=1 Tax=Fagus sylvatica TaxID=28930 RepID=A0A2N9HB90_FAGSY